MNPGDRDQEQGYGWLPHAVLGVALLRAMPSLWQAWSDDVYSRGAALAFAFWILPVGRRLLARSDGGFAWLVIALACGVGGAVSSLRVLDHLALAAAAIALVRPALSRFPWAVACIAWLPASGWLASKVSGGGMAGWERPLLALLSLSVFLIPVRKITPTLSS